MKTDKELFLTRYEGDLLAIARQYLRTGEPLEDMLQDGRIGILWAYDNQPPASDNLNDWVRQAIRKHITDALHNHAYTVQLPRRLAETTNHHPILPLDECPEAWQVPDTPAPSFQPLWDAITLLPNRQQQVLRLTYGLGSITFLSTSRIAQLLNITPNAVQHLRHRALATIRSILKT